MAWVKTVRNGYASAYEDLTLPTGASTDTVTSSIDYEALGIPRGACLTVFMNVKATDLASAAPTDVQVWCGPDAGWVTVVADFLADCDNAQVVGVWDGRNAAAHVSAPLIRLALDHAGNQTGESVRVGLVWDAQHDDNERW